MAAIPKTNLRRVGFEQVVLFVALAAYSAVVYVVVVALGGSVTGLGSRNAFLTIGATSLVAVTFGSVRERAQRSMRRVLYGERLTPLEVLDAFAAGVAQARSEDVLERMVRLVAEGTGAVRACVWIAQGDAFAPAAAFPGGGSVRRDVLPEGDAVVPIVHHGERLGVLTVEKEPGEPVAGAEEKLLGDVASQAGLVLRNHRLAAELEARVAEIAERAERLRASRRRVVAGQDAERRRLERDIHDGAQQHLVALAVKVRLARALAERDPPKAAEIVAELRTVADEAAQILRELTRGIHPPVLEEAGIGAALRARAKTFPFRTTVTDAGVRRYPASVEAAVYFSCLEAMQNAAKYARAKRVTVTIAETPFGLEFAVADDGVGFDVEGTPSGSGLQNLRDRLAAIGGSLVIRSEPGRGTTLSGDVAAAPVEAQP